MTSKTAKPSPLDPLWQIIVISLLTPIAAYGVPTLLFMPAINKCGEAMGNSPASMWCGIRGSILMLPLALIIIVAGFSFLFWRLKKSDVKNVELIFVTSFIFTIFFFLSHASRMFISSPYSLLIFIPSVLLIHYLLFGVIQKKIAGIRPSIVSLSVWAVLVGILFLIGRVAG